MRDTGCHSTRDCLSPTSWETVCHRGRPLVGFPWFSLQPKQPRVSIFGMVPAGLEPSTGLLGLIGHLGVVSWSMG